jgi:uncharacterized FlgJ-related protein
MAINQTYSQFKRNYNRALAKAFFLYPFKTTIVNPLVLYSQARVESSNFNSPLLTEYNNYFGMKMPRKRTTTASAENNQGFAVYRSPVDSIVDQLLRTHNFKKVKRMNVDQYLEFISKGYTTTMDNYSDTIRKIYIQEKLRNG